MSTTGATGPRPARDRTPGDAAPGTGLPVVVLVNVTLLTMIAPLATDMYVPAFPLVADELGVGATQVQLTLTTFFVGMALGQLVGGPVSDRLGRRRPLLVALVVMTLASVVCATTPGITLMMVARLVQGLAGGWAMVIARSVVVDLASGPRLVGGLNLVQGVAGVAPIVGPLVGALVLTLSDWRVSFWLLAAWSVVMVASVALTLDESLPAGRRHGGGLASLLGPVGQVLRRRSFRGYLVVVASSMGITFAYVATSAFVLQSMNGLSPGWYAVDFAVNALGLTVATLVAARLAGRVPTRRVIAAGLVATSAAGVLLLVGALWLDMPLGLALVGFLVLMSAQGLVGPNAGAMASGEVPEHPGTGSAVIGFLQWTAAGVVAPVAGLGGAGTAVPMALVVLALAAASLLALRLTSAP
ncbi:MAG: multidrug effflux MFS transporter [Nocardioidaceae bacterium]|nr:multidrug effflux MFS transporter [Nocardioidaceae bacterium]